MFRRNMTENAQEIIKNHLSAINKGNLVALDATVGNGFDLDFLSRLPEVVSVWGFDIQEEAVRKSEERVSEIKNKCIRVIKDSHHNINEYIQTPIDVAMFNLGYLPQGDKNIVTTTETTLSAIRKVIEQLADSGIISIMTYPGHEEGRIEHERIESMLSEFSQKQIRIMRLSMVNVNKPCPNIFIIIK